jgi:hypothetical protein
MQLVSPRHSYHRLNDDRNLVLELKSSLSLHIMTNQSALSDHHRPLELLLAIIPGKHELQKYDHYCDVCDKSPYESCYFAKL